MTRLKLASLKHEWAMQADLSRLAGGEEWERGRWSSETLAFYNPREWAAWLGARAQ